MTIHPHKLTCIEGGSAEHFTITFSPEVHFPLQLEVALPEAAKPQGSLAIYDEATKTYSNKAKEIIIDVPTVADRGSSLLLEIWQLPKFSGSAAASPKHPSPPPLSSLFQLQSSRWDSLPRMT